MSRSSSLVSVGLALVAVVAVAAALAGCAGSLGATSSELAMTSHPLAGDRGAVILARTALVRFSYSEGRKDATGAAHDTMAAAHGMAPSAGAAGVVNEGVGLAAAGVESYTVEVTQRCKILSEPGLACAKVSERVPDDATLSEIEGFTYASGAKALALDPKSAQIGGGALIFELPSAQVGSVVTFRYRISSHRLDQVGCPVEGRFPTVAASCRVNTKASVPVPFAYESREGTALPPPVRKAAGGDLPGQHREWLNWEVSNLPGPADGPSATIWLGDKAEAAISPPAPAAAAP